MRVRDLPTDQHALLVRPWVDPVVDQLGHDPRSAYVERFWLGVLGPSVTWLLRYIVDRLDSAPDGFDLDLEECALALGLGQRQGPNGAFPRTIARCCQFGASRLSGTTLEVRRKLPPLNLRQLCRLPEALRIEHARWVDQPPPAVAAADLRDRARRLALSLLDLGEDREATERQLHRWRFHPALASEAVSWAVERHATRPIIQPAPARSASAPLRANGTGQPKPSDGRAATTGARQPTPTDNRPTTTGVDMQATPGEARTPTDSPAAPGR